VRYLTLTPFSAAAAMFLPRYRNALLMYRGIQWGATMSSAFNEVMLFSCVGIFMMGVVLTAATLLR
jgi:hypothetical protein